MSKVAQKLLAGRTRPARTAVIYMDGAAASEAQQLREQYAAKVEQIAGGQTLADGATGLPELQAAIADADERAEATAVTFKFEALSRLALDELINAHPPEDGRGNFDIETFPPALIAASCVEPELTEEDVLHLWGELSDGETAALWNAAWSVQEFGLDPFHARI